MNKTLIAVAIAAFVSTGAIAAPARPMPTAPHNHHVQMVKPAGHSAKKYHNPAPKVAHKRPAPYIAHVRPTPPPPPPHHHHHYHNNNNALLGDVIIAFAILASNAL